MLGNAHNLANRFEQPGEICGEMIAALPMLDEGSVYVGLLAWCRDARFTSSRFNWMNVLADTT